MYTIHEPSGTITLDSDLEMDAYKYDKIIIEAAGGLVFNEDGHLLLMKRRGLWDLPKGKIDPGESLEECALREVSEETGLTQLKLIEFLKTTYHTYPYKNKVALKPSHWFRMEHNGQEHFIPQIEEDITEMRWADKKEAKKLMHSAFASIQEMVKTYFFTP